MKKPGRRFWIILVVLILVVVLAIVFWQWLSPLLPHPGLIEAWFRYLVEDLDIARWGPVAGLLLVAVIELIWAVALARRGGAEERQLKRLERLQAKEVAVLSQEIAQLQEGRQALVAELKLCGDLLREEEIRLWARFDDLQRASGATLDMLTPMTPTSVPSGLRGEWRHLVSQLERIEVVRSATVRGDRYAHATAEHVEELQRLGGACYHLEQYERALTHYRRAVELAPEDQDARINLAVVNHALGRHQIALQDLDGALRLGESPRAYLYSGFVRESSGEDRKALDDYDRALRLDADLEEAYHRRGLIYACLGEHDKALQDQNRVVELDANHAAALAARGVTRAALGDRPGSLADLDRGCTLAPDSYRVFYERGRVRYQFGMYEQALEDQDRTLELAPAFEPGLQARGDTYMAMERYEAAETDYAEAIERLPRHAAAYHARGKARLAKREYQAAVEDLDQALELDPSLAPVLADRGSAFEKLGDFDQALRDLDRAIALEPDLAIAHYNRGLAYGSMGEYDRASRDLNRAVELDPSLSTEQVGQSSGEAD